MLSQTPTMQLLVPAASVSNAKPTTTATAPKRQAAPAPAAAKAQQAQAKAPSKRDGNRRVGRRGGEACSLKRAVAFLSQPYAGLSDKPVVYSAVPGAPSREN